MSRVRGNTKIRFEGPVFNGALLKRISRLEARAMTKVGGEMQDRAVRYTPKDTGEARRGYHVDAEVTDRTVVVRLNNRARHIDELEHGQRPHTPSRLAIRGWVSRHLLGRKKGLNRRKRWLKKQIRLQRGKRKRTRITDEVKAQRREHLIESLTTMTVNAIRRSGTRPRRMGRQAGEYGLRVAVRQQRRALREAIRGAK